MSRTDPGARGVPDRERLPVELVDHDGVPVGTCSVAEAHTPPGRRHRAFSVLLFDKEGRALLQQRAAGKTRFPSRWSNTCCGHPAPGQDTAAAATRRLAEELGIEGGQITPLTGYGAFHYYATDPGTGRVEDEWDHVLVATLVRGEPVPDESEVRACRWLFPGAIRAGLTARPQEFTPWLRDVLDLAADGTPVSGRTSA